VKKVFTVILALLLILSFSTFALGEQDFMVVMEPIESQEYAEFPQTLDVNGTILGEQDDQISWIKLFIDDVERYQVVLNTNLGEDGYEFSLPWSINKQGSYEVKVVAHVERDGEVGVEVDGYQKNVRIHYDDPAEDDDEEAIDDEEADNEEANEEATENYPAAPAVAAKILKDLGIKHNYGDGNYINDIAKEMGPGTEFQGVAKTDTVAYEAEIRAFLLDHEAWGEEIEKGKPAKEQNNARELNAVDKGPKKDK